MTLVENLAPQEELMPNPEAQSKPSVTVAGGMTLQDFMDKISTPRGLPSITSTLTPSTAKRILASAKELGTEDPKDWTFETVLGEPTGYMH